MLPFSAIAIVSHSSLYHTNNRFVNVAAALAVHVVQCVMCIELNVSVYLSFDDVRAAYRRK